MYKERFTVSLYREDLSSWLDQLLTVRPVQSECAPARHLSVFSSTN